MYYVITADLHIGLSEQHDQDVIKGCNEIALVVKKYDPCILIIAGDVFDQPKPTPGQYKLFEDCLDIIQAMEVYVIPGNHDRNSKHDTMVAYAGHYFHRQGTKFITEIWDTDEFIFAPFEHGEDYGIHLLDTLENDFGYGVTKDKVLITHLDIPGATFGAERDIMLGQVGSLPNLSKFKLKRIISGHIHKHQMGVYGGIPFAYPGSLTRTSHSEGKEPKGFLLYDTETDKLEFIKRKTDRKWVTVDISWKGKLPEIKKVADVLRVNITADKKYSGKIDRKKILESLYKNYEEVKINVVYDVAINKEVENVASGSFSEFETTWVQANTKGIKIAVDKKIKQILSTIDIDVVKDGYDNFSLKEIHITNYQSMTEAHIKLNKNDCIGIVGMVNGEYSQSNGTGKSTILESIRLALHNTTRFSKNVNAIQQGKDMARVELVFDSNKGIIFLDRELGKTGSTAYVNNGKSDKPLAKGKEVVEWVKQNFGLGLKAFESIVFLSRDNSIVKRTDTERLKAMQEPLPLEKYTKARVVAARERKDLGSVVDGLQGVIDNYSDVDFSELDKLNDSKKKVNKDIQEETKKLNNAVVELKVIDKTFSDIEKYDILQQVNISNEDEIKLINENQYPEQIKKYDEKKIEAEIKELNIRLKKGKTIRDDIENKKGENKGRVGMFMEMAELVKSDCPVCQSKIGKDKARKLQDMYVGEVVKLEVEREKLDTQSVTMCTHYDKLTRDLEGWTEKQNGLFLLKDSYKQAKVRLVKCQKLLKEGQDKIKEKFKHTVKLDKKEISSLKKNYNQLVDKEVLFGENLNELSSDLNQIDNQVSVIKDNKKRFDDATKQIKIKQKNYDVIDKVVEAFSPKGISQQVVQSVIEEINVVIPTIIADINFWQDITVELELDLEKSTVGIYVAFGDKDWQEIEGLSSGEKEIVSLIISFAYRHVLNNLINVKYNFVLIDEILDCLDNKNLGNMISYLKKSKLQTLAISHSDLKDSFNKLVIVDSDGTEAVVR